MNSIIEGNVTKIDENNGWFMGHFTPKNSEFGTEDFEIKWANCLKGWTKGTMEATKCSKTLCILIKGIFRFGFPNQKKEIVLREEGDFVFFEPLTYYNSEALKDSVLLVIRWPSIADDKIKI